MSTSLTVLNNSATIQEGGLGVDFSSPLFKLKPATLTIVQPNSQVAGAVKGNLRIAETGDQYEEMFATLLTMPQEQYQYHIGTPGELNRTIENLMCFSRDLIKPDKGSKVPQAMLCANCVRRDWTAWREFKEKNNGMTNKALIPPCDASYYVILLDTVYRLPLRMYIRSKARDPFEAGMQNLARTLAMGNAQGKKSNIFDVRFRLSTKLITSGKFTSYVPTFTDFRYVTDEERQAFGEVYLNYVAQRNQPQLASGPTPGNPADAVGSGNTAPLEGIYESQPDDDIPF